MEHSELSPADIDNDIQCFYEPTTHILGFNLSLQSVLNIFLIINGIFVYPSNLYSSYYILISVFTLIFSMKYCTTTFLVIPIWLFQPQSRKYKRKSVDSIILDFLIFRTNIICYYKIDWKQLTQNKISWTQHGQINLSPALLTHLFKKLKSKVPLIHLHVNLTLLQNRINSLFLINNASSSP